MASARGDISFRLNVCLIIISTIFVALRYYVRGFMTKTLGWDDLFAGIAYVLLLAQSALEIKEVGLGAGQQITTLSPATLGQFFSILPTMQLLYFAATCFVRLSIVAFLPRLNKDRKFLRLVWALGFLIVSLSLTCFMIELFECKHVPDLWNGAAPNRKCMSKTREGYMFWTHAAIGVVIDITLLVIPIVLIYKKMMFSRTAIKVMIVLSVGLFVAITGIVRLAIIVNVNFAVNTTYQLPTVSVWTDLEGHVGLWVSCFPPLQPLLRIISVKLGLRSKVNSSRPKYGGTGTWKNERSGYVQSGTGSRTGIKDAWDGESGKGIVEMDVEAVAMDSLHSSREAGFGNGGNGMGMNGIVKTTKVDVESEEGKWEGHHRDRSWVAL